MSRTVTNLRREIRHNWRTVRRTNLMEIGCIHEVSHAANLHSYKSQSQGHEAPVSIGYSSLSWFHPLIAFQRKDAR